MYKLTKSESSVYKIDSNLYIPFDYNNSDYQNYLKWLEGYEQQGRDLVKTSEGNTPLPADE